MTDSDQSNDVETSDDIKMTETPPTAIGGMLRRLGHGLIVAGSIVGSGELIATTKTGAEAGFWLLWLIYACLVYSVCDLLLRYVSCSLYESNLTPLSLMM